MWICACTYVLVGGAGRRTNDGRRLGVGDRKRRRSSGAVVVVASSRVKFDNCIYIYIYV